MTGQTRAAPAQVPEQGLIDLQLLVWLMPLLPERPSPGQRCYITSQAWLLAANAPRPDNAWGGYGCNKQNENP